MGEKVGWAKVAFTAIHTPTHLSIYLDMVAAIYLNKLVVADLSSSRIAFEDSQANKTFLLLLVYLRRQFRAQIISLYQWESEQKRDGDGDGEPMITSKSATNTNLCSGARWELARIGLAGAKAIIIFQIELVFPPILVLKFHP